MKKSSILSKIKVIICVMLCLVAVMPATACSGSDKGNDKIVVTCINSGFTQPDIDKVEAAISARTKEKLGFEVELYPMSYSKLSTYPTLIGGGTQLDVISMAFGPDPKAYAASGLVKKFTDDELKQYAPDVQAVVDGGTNLYIRDNNDNIVAVSCIEREFFYSGSYVLRKADFEAAGLSEKYQNGQKVSYEDLDTIFAALKTTFPDSYPCGNNGSALSDVSYYFIPCDEMGASKSTGVIDFSGGVSGTNVVNYYATDAYKNYVTHMRKWNQAGYVMPNATTATESTTDYFSNKVTLGLFSEGSPEAAETYAGHAGEAVVQLRLTDFYIKRGATAGAGLNWSVGGSSKNKYNALKFINLMETDEVIMNLLQNGIEGSHYKFVDKEAGIITFPEGVTKENSGFYFPGGYYGDKNKIYTFIQAGQSVETVAAAKRLTQECLEEAKKNVSPAVGFEYDGTAKRQKITEIENICNKYTQGLGCGSADNYNAFISELNAAGINEILADKQAQLNAFLAAK